MDGKLQEGLLTLTADQHEPDLNDPGRSDPSLPVCLPACAVSSTMAQHEMGFVRCRFGEAVSTAVGLSRRQAGQVKLCLPDTTRF